MVQRRGTLDAKGCCIMANDDQLNLIRSLEQRVKDCNLEIKAADERIRALEVRAEKTKGLLRQLLESTDSWPESHLNSRFIIGDLWLLWGIK